MGDMAGEQNRRRSTRRALIWVLAVAAVALLAAVAAIVVPILTHQSAGGSGQTVPEGFVSETRAVGADGRTRTLTVETADGAPADLSAVRPGDVLTVRGSGFDPAIGIYVSICAIPVGDLAGEKPGPCLGGLPEGAMTEDTPGDVAKVEPQTSVWITNDWAWRSFATQQYNGDGAGDFVARVLVADPVQENLDCTTVRCALTTRADHTAANDRVQDLMLPVAYAN